MGTVEACLSFAFLTYCLCDGYDKLRNLQQQIQFGQVWVGQRMLSFAPIPLLFGLPGLLLGFWAQFRVRSAWNTFSAVTSELGVSGAQVARYILDTSGLGHVTVEETHGFLTDHYDPAGKTLRLSKGVYRGKSVAAMGVAAHEAGHALQDSDSYRPLTLRSGMVPGVQIGSWLGPILFSIGLALPSAWGQILALLGLVLFGTISLFALITLPVEFDASRACQAGPCQRGARHRPAGTERRQEGSGCRGSVLCGCCRAGVHGPVSIISMCFWSKAGKAANRKSGFERLNLQVAAGLNTAPGCSWVVDPAPI